MSTEMTNFDLIVVGGGVSGVAAAVTAAQAGLQVLVLERQPRLGGRARSWKDPTTKDPVHIGPHIIYDPDYVNFYKLVELLGTASKIKWQDKPGGHFMTWVDGEEQDHYGPVSSLPAPLNWMPALLKDRHIGFADIHSVVPIVAFALKATEAELMALDNESGYEFLRRNNVTEKMIKHFWAFVCHALCNVPVEEVSATALLRFFQRFIGTQLPIRMGFADGGLGEFFEPASEVLKGLGSEVRLKTLVKGFVGTDERVDGVVLEDGQILTAKVGVVVTLAAPQLPTLMKEQWLAAGHPSKLGQLSIFRPCSYLCTYMWFDKKVTDMQFWSRTWDDLKSWYCDWYDFSNIATGWEDRGSYIQTNCIDSEERGLHHLPDEEVFQKALSELRENLPAARDAKVVHWTVNRVPMAIPRPIVGSESVRPMAGPVAGVAKLFLAGDICQTQSVFPYCMENAAKSGFMCAERVVEAAAREGLAVHSAPIVVPAPIIGASRVSWMIGSVIDFVGKVGTLFSGQAAPPASKL